MAKCQNPDCGLAWLDPEPLEEDIHKAYQNYYTHNVDGYSKSVGRRLRSAGFQLVLKVSTFLCGLSKQKNNLERMHLDKAPLGRLLDIGCGGGAFLNKMKASGWTVEGLDFDSEAVRAAIETYGVQARVGSLEEIGYASESFDAITMHHVIEHVYHPVTLLREIRRILKPGGRLIVVTPNSNSWGHEWFGENWRGLEPPRHVRLFNSRALARTAAAAGFQKIHVYSTAANAWNLIAFSIALANAAKMNRFLEPVGPFIKLRALAMQFREAWLNLDNHDLGEECVLVART